MTKQLQQFKNILISFLIIEIGLIVMLYLSLQSSLLLALCFYITIKNLLCIAVISYAVHYLNHNNMSVSEAVSQDAANAFIFGGVGLIRYDDNRNIVWTSDLFKALNINIVGSKLLEWQPLLASLFEEDDVKTIDVNSRKYEVYNNTETRLLYLKDVTDYVNVAKEYEDQQLCVAYITIDNYDESVEHADEQTAALIQSTSRQIIFDWGKENGVILKRYKSDAFIAIFNERVYRKQVEEHFKILDIFREKITELNEVMTLSIGIGRGSKILGELDQLAFSSLSLTYSRGGDQVAVKTSGKETRFYGGNSESFEKSSRIKTRVIAQSLSGIIKQASNVLIMGHRNSDLDSFGASVAMYRVVKAFGRDVNIIVDYDSMEEKTLQAAKSMKDDPLYRGVFVSGNRINEFNRSHTLLISVDNHKPSLAIDKNVLDVIKNIVIIDHHRRGEEFMNLPVLSYLEPAASSTIEMIVELFEYLNVDIKLTEYEATLLYAGMLVDTNYLKTRVGARTFGVAAKLKDMQADVGGAYHMLEDNYATTQAKISITKNAYQYAPGIIIAYGDNETIYPQALLAKVGNELMAVSEIKAAFTIGRVSKEKVAISARSSKDINVQLIMEKLGGGGHFTMAACQIESDDIDNVITKLEDVIDAYLDERGNE